MKSNIFNGKEYRYVELRGRGKWIAKDGDAFNPIRVNQEVTIHYNEDGYPCFGGGIPVHLYVAYAWVDGYFDGAEVNHKDFNRENFHTSNLEWVTHSDNIKDSVENNSEIWNASKQGTHNGRATFTEDEVRDIRNKYDNGMSVTDIVRIYHPELQTSSQYKNIHSTFSNICKRKTWKHIE